MRLEYGIDQKVPLLKSLLIGLQWAAVLVSSIVILGRVIGEVHGGESFVRIVYLQKLLFLSATALVSQVFWGHRLPVVPGPAAVLLIGVMAGQGFGIPAIYTSVMIGGGVMVLLAWSGLLGRVQKLFTANVVAAVLLLIAFTLAPAIQRLMIGDPGGIHPVQSLGFALILLLLMFAAYRLLKGVWRSTLIIWAMIAASFFHLWIFPVSGPDDLFSGTPWISGPFRQMTPHLSVQPGVLLSFVFCYLALAVNDLGSMQAVGELLHLRDMTGRIRRGIGITGLANIASGWMGVVGPVNYSLSPGIIASTGCASRFTLLPAAAMMLAIAFSPAATGWVGSVPSVVIGAVLAYVMAAQVSAGLIVAFKAGNGDAFPFENGLVIGLSVLLGNLIAFFPGPVVDAMPPFLRPILGNGFVMGVFTALVLEHVVVVRKGKK